MRAPWRTMRLRAHPFRASPPRTLGSGVPYFAMIALNAIGSRHFAPFSVLYLHQVIGILLPFVGLGLSGHRMRTAAAGDSRRRLSH